MMAALFTTFVKNLLKLGFAETSEFQQSFGEIISRLLKLVLLLL
jgi:hypothetical protein